MTPLLDAVAERIGQSRRGGAGLNFRRLALAAGRVRGSPASHTFPMKNKPIKHGPVTLAELASAGFNFGKAVVTTVKVDALAIGGVR